MPLLIVQLAILIAVAFVVGCIIGRIVRRRKASRTDNERVIIAAALSKPAVNETPEPIGPGKLADTESGGVSDEQKDGEALNIDAGPEPVATVIEDDTPAEEAAPEDVAEETVEIEEPGRPELLDAARRGKPDDLTAIKGIGKAVGEMLHGLGIFHYNQVAAWSADEAAWIEKHIGFPGRVQREEWVSQAGKLAASTAKPASKRNAKGKKAVEKKAKPRTPRKRAAG
ncbi:hypothetical protein H7Q97_05115 [Ochrobactrum sp. CM-21-5]|nr:hypothetical protein [Ochrobactrum sp. CM-21-5]MBC2884782.1 hypothetical protein [Ochrobactrum sp. CM-21-5]